MKSILTLCLFLAIAWTTTAQNTATSESTYTYKDQEYIVHIGERGGHYIILDDSTRHYIASAERVRTALPKDNGDGTATYHDQKFPIKTGSRGGRYIVYYGNKIYIPKS